MLFRGGQAGGISLNGLELDVARSCIQKYARRGVLDKALYCLWEMEMFSDLLLAELEETRRRALKALGTNIINRLLVISIEDVGIGCIGIPSIVKYAYREYKLGDINARRRALYVLMQSLCESKKSRELSHINCVYYLVLHSDKKEEYVTKYPEIYSFNMLIENLMAGFIKLYNQGSDGCFYYLLLQLHRNEKLSIIPMLMHVIDSEKEYKRKEIMNVLFLWYKDFTFKEYFLFALQIVLIGLRKELQVDMIYINLKIQLMNDATNNVWKNSYLLNLEGHKIEIDGYAIDKHTREGRKKGKDLRDFANEGCYVENEHPIVNQQYKEIYILFRLSHANVERLEKLDHSCDSVTKTGNPCKNKGKYQLGDLWYCSIHNPDKSSKDVLELKSTVLLLIDVKHQISQETLDLLYSGPRGLLMTGKYKKLVFIPIDGPLAGKVVKGPWYSSDIEKLNRMITRLREAKKWNVPLIPFVIAHGADGEGYTVYRNLSSVSSDKWLMDEKDDQFVTGSSSRVKVLQRESMGIYQLHKIEKLLLDTILFGDLFLFKGLILMAILEVGDVGPWNIVVATDKTYIIDYEDCTTKTEFTEIGHLYAKKANCYTEQLTMGILKNKLKITLMIEEFDKEYSEKERWQQIKRVLELLM